MSYIDNSASFGNYTPNLDVPMCEPHNFQQQSLFDTYYQPTYQPTNQPTYQPTNQPIYQPTNQPTYQPTNQPTYQPTYQPIELINPYNSQYENQFPVDYFEENKPAFLNIILEMPDLSLPQITSPIPTVAPIIKEEPLIVESIIPEEPLIVASINPNNNQYAHPYDTSSNQENISPVPTENPTTQNILKCIECSKIFSGVAYLSQHNNAHHSGEKPFRCKQCGKRFATEEIYQVHFAKHSSMDKRFKCDQCPKQFHYNADLRRHFNTLHLGFTKHACSFCNKSFSRRDHMLAHQLVHARKKT